MTTISGHTTRATGTILTAAIYNFDHNNHVNNANALNAGKIEGVTPPVVAGNFMVFADTSGNAAAESGVGPGTFLPLSGGTMTGRINQALAGFEGVNKNDITTRTDSGFYETNTGTLAEGWPLDTGAHQHMLSCTHTNDANNFAMQFSADFFTQRLFYRSVADLGSRPWLAVRLAGKESIWLPAGAWKPMTTGAPASVTLEVQGANSDIFSLDFDPTTAEFAWAFVAMPKSWNVGQISAKVYWAHPATVTNFGVTWQFAAHALSNDDSFNFSHTAAASVSDTGGTTNDLYITAETSLFTIAGSPAAQDMVALRIARIPTDAGDTMAVDAKFVGLMMHYTTNANDDS